MNLNIYALFSHTSVCILVIHKDCCLSFFVCLMDHVVEMLCWVYHLLFVKQNVIHRNRSRRTSLSSWAPLLEDPHMHTSRPCHRPCDLTLIFRFDAWLSALAEGRCLWEWASCKVLINDHRPCRQIYDDGGYKEMWDSAASHLHSYT